MTSHDGGDVSDSTDWLGTPLACLMPVEAAFRCHVCKDFYNSPMITSCNHSFCSLCIRRCLSVEGKCPVCRATDQESKLRGNWALRDAVDSFVKARSAILELARNPPIPPPRQLPPKRKVEDAAGSGSSAAGGSQEEPQAKRTRTSTRLSKTKAAEAVASIAYDESEGDEDVVEVQAPKTRGSNGADADTDYKPDDGLIECPICGTRVKMTLINSHLDNNCSTGTAHPKLTSAISKPAASTSFKPLFSGAAPIKAPERMPSMSYSLLTDTALRKKMSSLGLSSAGPRLLLERRHKEWSTIWNANCDSARPKRKQELLRDLDIWERTVGALVAGGAGASTIASRPIVAATQQAAMIKDKNFDASAWKERHNTSFQDLIANARRSRSKAHEPKGKKTREDATANAEDEKAALETTPQAGEQLGTEDAAVSIAIPDSNPSSPISDTTDDAPAGREATPDAAQPHTGYDARKASRKPGGAMVVEL